MSSQVDQVGLDGRIIDRSYRLHERLGGGGMGAVYRASQLLTGQVVALKLVSPGRGPDSSGGIHSITDWQLRLALAREFQTLASLHHPNIIRVLDYGFDQELGPYFTMELLHGPQSLLAAALPLPLESKVQLIAQLLRALVYVHQRGILHRDIKPSNVLVVDGVVKLLDFGVASQSSGESGLAGTPAYMAPELLLERPPSVQSDLYSVGVLLHQVLLGSLPYARESMVGVLHELLGDSADRTFSPTVASVLNSYLQSQRRVAAASAADTDAALRRERSRPLPADLPPALADTLQRLIARHPQERPDSASTILRELAGAMQSPVPIETAATRESFLQATNLIGREPELRLLSDAVEQARQGVGSAFLIGGESGIGKSRLLSEVRTQALVRGLWVVEGQSVTEGGLYYQEVLPLLRALCVRAELADAEATALKPFVPDIAALLGRPVPDPELPTAEELQSRLVQIVDALLARLGRPLLLLLEDLQWARPETLAWVGHLLPALSRLPILLVGTFRSDERAELPARLPSARHLPLRRLGRDEIARLSESMLGPAGRAAALVSYLERQTEGNIFFLVEVVRALGENAGELRRVHEGQLPEQVLTAGIERIVDRRIDQVQHAYRPLLELAATCGRKLNVPLLERVFPSLSVADFLVECANAAVLQSQGSDWQFAHDKLRERILRRLTEEGKRQRLHLQIAETLERLSLEGATLQKSEALIGYHFRQAGLYDRALHHYRLAGDRVARLCLYEEALLHYESAEEVLRLLPSTPALRRQHVELLTRLVQCSSLALSPHVNLQRTAQAQDILESLRQHGAAVPADRLYQARLDHESGRLYTYLGQYRQAIACFERAIPVMEELQDGQPLLITQIMHGRVLLTSGQIDRAIAELEPRVGDLEAWIGRDIEALRAFSYLGIAYAMNGRSRDAVRLREHVAPWMGQNLQSAYQISFYMNFCFVDSFAGDLGSALQFNSRALELAAQSGTAILEYVLWDVRAFIYKLKGDLETALQHQLHASALRQRVGGNYLHDVFVAHHADILLHLGRSEEAAELGARAVDIAAATGSVLGVPAGQRVLGWAKARLGAEPAVVDAHLAESLRVAVASGFLWERLRIELAWADICRERHDLAAARRYLLQAREHVTDVLLPADKESLLRLIADRLASCDAG